MKTPVRDPIPPRPFLSYISLDFRALSSYGRHFIYILLVGIKLLTLVYNRIHMYVYIVIYIKYS